MDAQAAAMSHGTLGLFGLVKESESAITAEEREILRAIREGRLVTVPVVRSPVAVVR